MQKQPRSLDPKHKLMDPLESKFMLGNYMHKEVTLHGTCCILTDCRIKGSGYL